MPAPGQLLWTGRLDAGVRGLAVSADGTHVIAGGSFLTADGASHKRLVSLRVADGTAEPTWKASVGGVVRDVVVVGDTAYFGGQFAAHDGIAAALARGRLGEHR